MNYKTKRRWGWVLIGIAAIIALIYFYGLCIIINEVIGWKGLCAVLGGSTVTVIIFVLGMELIGTHK